MRWTAVPALGFALISWNAEAAQCTNVRPYEASLGIVSSPVLIVSDVQSGSIADRAGLRPGDIVLSTNSRGIRDRATFQEFLGQIREHALWQAADLAVLSGVDGPGSVKRHVLIRMATPDDRMGFTSAFGFYVERVKAGSIAERFGMKAGDFITRVGDARTGNLRGPGDLDLLVQESVDQGRMSMEVSRLQSAQGGITQWTTRDLTWSLSDPLDGPTPPPRKPEIIRQ
jgi:S1-C subfamily serine protease